MIGGTPLIELRVRWRGKRRRVFAKAESLNMTGSIKDRMAAHILGVAFERGELRPRDEIVEASSGNTAIAFAAIGRALGHPMRIFMPDWMSAERVKILGAFGATLCPVSRAQGGFVGSIERAASYAGAAPGRFAPRQFENSANVDAHRFFTGAEIVSQLRAAGVEPDVFVAGVGTGGTVMGVGATLRAAFPRVRIHPLEPAESPVLTLGHHCGQHRIQGISDEFVPSIVDLTALDAIVAAGDGDSIRMAQRLARECGLGVGISSGANVVGALKLLERADDDAVAVTVFADSHKKYLSTALFADEPIRDGDVTSDVVFDGWSAHACAR
ncbi:MAG: PLP-dependent cysteine synthase family protein [Planctomycetes bacterium]|nr:PLP-dependent cysteine synthase family protein [Planctomycetota bacterium]